MKALYLTAICFLFSCASTHPGHQGRSLNGESLPFLISAQTIDGSAEESFQLIELTFENTSDRWMKISHSEVVIDNPAESKLSVVLGSDLKDWAQARELQAKKDEHNEQLVNAGIAAVSGIAFATGSKTNKTADGLTAAGLTLATLSAIDGIKKSVRSSEQADKVPENHLYQPFSVPGKMFLRRWILLNKPANTSLQNLVVELETVEGTKGKYEISL